MTDAERPEDTLEDRVPCGDDMCVGVIGPSGKCGVCGRPGTPPEPSSKAPEHPKDDLHQGDEVAPPAEPALQAAPSSAPPEDAPADDDGDRVPCLDDMCVGILSPQGKCGTCGKTWPGLRPG